MLNLNSAFLGFTPKKNGFSLGLDVGSRYIKTVLLAPDGKGKFILQGYAIEKILDEPVAAIRIAFEQTGVKEAAVISSLAGTSVVARYIELPVMTDKELNTAIEFEAEKVIPYNINEVVVDCCRVENIDDKKMRVILVAAKKDFVFDRIKILNAANIQPKVLDVDAFALMNAFTSSNKGTAELSALLNIGANVTNLNIVKGQRSFLCRDINFGSDEISRIMNEAADAVENEETTDEDWLLKIDELSVDMRKKVLAALNEMINRLADEVRLSFDFFENRYGEVIKAIYLSGGLAKVEVVNTLMKNEFDCEVSKWNWAEAVSMGERVVAEDIYRDYPQLALAYGLALRGF
ncbi:MAG: type IV pilus assembly protein PilM [Candidatus Omnitrophota bacterium]